VSFWGTRVLPLTLVVGAQCEPDSFAYCALIAAAGKAGLLQESQEVFHQARAEGVHSTFLFNNLIDACARCKALDQALEVFESVCLHPMPPVEERESVE
jgi:hypothetical protein